MTSKRAISLIGRSADINDPAWVADALLLENVTVDGYRIGLCYLADEDAGVVVCAYGPPRLDAKNRPDVGYRMVEVRGTVKIA